MAARSTARHIPASLVRFACGRPLLYPVAVADLPAPLRATATPGARFAGAVFPLGLPPVRRGERYAAAALRVDLRHPDPCRVVALAVHADAGEFGISPDGGCSTPLAWRALRAAAGFLRSGTPAATVDGAGTSRFGWRFTDRRAAPNLPRDLSGHALLEIAPGVSTLLGFLTAEADLSGPALRRVSAPRPLAFSVPVPDSPGPSPATRLWLAAAPADPASDPDGVAVAEVLAAAGVGDRRPLGAGRFATLPPETDVPGLVSVLAAAVAARSARRSVSDGVRLRFALHRTLWERHDREPAVDQACAAEQALGALLEAAAVRAALSEHQDAAFALVVPDALFRDTVAGGDGPPDPAAFRRITAGGHAWLYLRRPGLPG
ncbi:hypothetical protein [Catenuloplanes japonicus]|uniref:hypothetical protein n=1 Tax=Catenuloplanes japonicus TaxID=33876 RepID=UPI000526B357|nr:hypothetical protein [Catenuloplanes japonicus]